MREERLYLGGCEVYRKSLISTGVVQDERETVHLSDDDRRVCMAETKTVTNENPVGSPTTYLRFQLDNHLGTCAVEVEADGAVVSYEEYHPYGTSAYRAQRGTLDVSAKRYRYTGKERDEETGLYYHGARYYAPWLGRWTAADPLAFAGGAGPYGYVSNRPIVMHDPDGRTEHDPESTGAQGAGAGAPPPADEGLPEPTPPVEPETLTGVVTLEPLTITLNERRLQAIRDLKTHHKIQIKESTDPAITDERIFAAQERVANKSPKASRGPTRSTSPYRELTPRELATYASAGLALSPTYFGDWASAAISWGLFADEPSWLGAFEAGVDSLGAALPYFPAWASIARAERLEDALVAR